MSKLIRSAAWISLAMSASAAPLSASPSLKPVPAPQATISSDEMELIDNGAKTIFSGHVVLEQIPYVLKADRMTRFKDTGIVESEGHILGHWNQPKGEKTVAEGSNARYTPEIETTELWGSPRIRHWDSASDANPLEITAERFIARQSDQILFAKNDVWIRRGQEFQSHSEEAQFDQKLQVVQLSGKTPAAIDWTDAQGSGHFSSDRAALYMSPRHARLMDNVKGHVIPSP